MEDTALFSTRRHKMYDLFDLKAPALIIPYDDSSINEEYYNQVGGVSCMKRSAKGRLVLCYMYEDVPNLFCPSLWYMNPYQNTAVNIADALVSFKDGRVSISDEEVSVLSIEVECEAWAKIKIIDHGVLKDAYLTWQNCD